METTKKNRVIFDPINSFINLTDVEWEIIHSPFYQRLRWIKQLGFTCYLFPGAEHSRFGHSIGALQNAHRILRSIGKAVNDNELFDSNCMHKEALFHKSVRLGALLHDLGAFCFSHTTEKAYIKYGKDTNHEQKHLDDHENLGSYIIKNTNYKGGITYILKKYGYDPQTISDLVKGVDPSILANQILHSEIDCDRMDYLLRDAHYTGLNYGSYDREYLLHHFKIKVIDGHEILTIKHNALHCVEDFLMSRYSWYSQVIRSPRGARYDSLAQTMTYYLLEKGLIYSYQDLLNMVAKDPEKFFGFNDSYFMNTLQERYSSGALDSDPVIKSMAQTLLFSKEIRSIQIKEFKQRLVSQDDPTEFNKFYKKAHDKASEIESFLSKSGGPEDWIIVELPEKNIVFVESIAQIQKSGDGGNLLLKRDPAKIYMHNGEVKFLGQVENSIISRLENSKNFVPNVFCSRSAYKLLMDNKIISEDF